MKEPKMKEIDRKGNTDIIACVQQMVTTPLYIFHEYKRSNRKIWKEKERERRDVQM